jgi:hypothetical protein
MARPIVDVLPARGPGGHRLYSPGADSECPGHRFCAYDGTETDRCPICHTTFSRGCEHLVPKAKRAGRVVPSKRDDLREE